eukprot:scaffold305133_cov68-Attheya_sp.AAC.2
MFNPYPLLLKRGRKRFQTDSKLSCREAGVARAHGQVERNPDLERARDRLLTSNRNDRSEIG